MHRSRAAAGFPRPLAVACSVLLVCGAVDAQTRIEPPMRVASQAPLQSTRLAMIPAVTGHLRGGDVRVEWSETWTNVWVNERPAMLLDYEALETRLTTTWAISESWALQLDLDERRRFGGALDAVIQNFHGVIGNGLNGRDTVPRNSVNIEVRHPDTGRSVLELHDERTFSRGISPTVARSQQVFGGRFTLAATARFPVSHAGDELTSGSDFGLSAGWSRRHGTTSVHLAAGITRTGNVRVDFPIERLQKTGLVSVVRPLTRRTAAVLQYLYNDGVAGSGPLAAGVHEVTVGGRIHISGSTAVDFGIIENLINYDNGPDVGVHLGVSRTIR